jgi:hypothetical protein
VTSVHDGVVDGRTVIDSADGSSRSFAFATYDLRSGAFTPLPPDRLGVPAGNGRGWLAADAADGAVLTRPGAGGAVDSVALPGLVPLSGDLMTRHLQVPLPVLLSTDGRLVAGQAVDASGQPQAVVWRCG